MNLSSANAEPSTGVTYVKPAYTGRHSADLRNMLSSYLGNYSKASTDAERSQAGDLLIKGMYGEYPSVNVSRFSAMNHEFRHQLITGDWEGCSRTAQEMASTAFSSFAVPPPPRLVPVLPSVYDKDWVSSGRDNGQWQNAVESTFSQNTVLPPTPPGDQPPPLPPPDGWTNTSMMPSNKSSVPSRRSRAGSTKRSEGHTSEVRFQPSVQNSQEPSMTPSHVPSVYNQTESYASLPSAPPPMVPSSMAIGYGGPPMHNSMYTQHLVPSVG